MEGCASALSLAGFAGGAVDRRRNLGADEHRHAAVAGLLLGPDKD